MLSSPIGWIGGKSRLRRAVLARIPEHHCYIEPFAGAAWILFAKDLERSQVEVINDFNGELANFWRCVRDRHLELIEKLKFRLIIQHDFMRIRSKWGDLGRDEIERAADFFWLIKHSFGGKSGKRATFGYSAREKHGYDLDLIQLTLQRAYERLQRVYIFNEDFERLIDRFDREDSFFYCDPPYYGCESCYEADFTGKHERLAERLQKLKGRFLLSYNDCDEIRTLYDGWCKIESIQTRYSLSNQRLADQSKSKASEVFIMNY